MFAILKCGYHFTKVKVNFKVFTELTKIGHTEPFVDLMCISYVYCVPAIKNKVSDRTLIHGGR